MRRFLLAALSAVFWCTALGWCAYLLIRRRSPSGAARLPRKAALPPGAEPAA